MVSVYLAGGFKTGWQARFKSLVIGVHVYDPSEYAVDNPAVYTAMDLAAICESDIVVVMHEDSNPGTALWIEMGYGLALGKQVILVTQSDHKYYDFAKHAASNTVRTLEEAAQLVMRVHENRTSGMGYRRASNR